MRRVLVSWIGGNDLKAVGNGSSGPVLSTLKNEAFDSVELLYAYPRAEVEHYLSCIGIKGFCEVGPCVFSYSLLEMVAVTLDTAESGKFA